MSHTPSLATTKKAACSESGKERNSGLCVTPSLAPIASPNERLTASPGPWKFAS
jgi:hypothetical protein